MSLALLVTAALIGPHASLSADQWRDEYKATLLATAERAKPRPEQAVPRLVSLYESLEHAEALPRGERMRMRQTLRMRRLLRALRWCQHLQQFPQRRSPSGWSHCSVRRDRPAA